MAYRILSFSGGGARGIYQAYSLRYIAAYLKGPMASHFDLIAGTSTGAICAFAVAFEISADQVIELYKNEGRKILAKTRAWNKLRVPRYFSEPLKEVLVRVFGDRRLEDCPKDVVIPATSLNRYRHRVFTNLPRGIGVPPDPIDQRLRIVDVIMASCAAPLYFPSVQPMGSERSYVDGGLWANCPSLVAIIAAKANTGIPFDDMKVVHIGNGQVAEGLPGTRYDNLGKGILGLYRSVTMLYDLMFAAQATSTDFVTESLVGPQNCISINDPLPQGVELDDIEKSIEVLPALAERAARDDVRSKVDWLTH